MMLTKTDLTNFASSGYLIIENAIPDGMLDPLREAADRVTRKTRAGEWAHRRDAGDGDIWGISHLLHPDLGEPTFAKYIASPEVIDVVGELLGLSEDERPRKLQLELVNMLVNPTTHNYEIAWHRDLVRADLEPEQEMAELSKLQHGVQWNTALYDEACLYIVPGSHMRPKTSEERDIVSNHPKDRMPDQMAVDLKAGQGVYYNANLLHRGVYRMGVRRETLHCCMGTIDGAALRPHLYRELSWMTSPLFRETLPSMLVPLYKNFLAANESVESRQEQK